jgi:hypothetical protein
MIAAHPPTLLFDVRSFRDLPHLTMSGCLQYDVVEKPELGSITDTHSVMSQAIA